LIFHDAIDSLSDLGSQSRSSLLRCEAPLLLEVLELTIELSMMLPKNSILVDVLLSTVQLISEGLDQHLHQLFDVDLADRSYHLQLV
jgi:hypothetical protein